MLGIPRATAEKSIDTIIKREGNDITVEKLIKLALRLALDKIFRLLPQKTLNFGKNRKNIVQLLRLI